METPPRPCHQRQDGCHRANRTRAALIFPILHCGCMGFGPRSAFRTFLHRLELEGMIDRQAGHHQLVITICNYEKYQMPNPARGQQTGQRWASDGPETEQGNKETKTIPAPALLSLTASMSSTRHFRSEWIGRPQRKLTRPRLVEGTATPKASWWRHNVTQLKQPALNEIHKASDNVAECNQLSQRDAGADN